MPATVSDDSSDVAEERSAAVLHGAWVPDDESGGRFFVWAETVRRRSRTRAGEHPFQLRWEQLAQALAEAWPHLLEPAGFSSRRSPAWAVLPGDGVRPAPSPELQAESNEEIAAVTGWGPWRVDAAEVANPRALLRSPDPQRAGATRSIRIGQDLRFWSHLTACFERAVRHHEYLPAIYAEESNGTEARGNRRTRTRKTAVRFQAGWEFADSMEESVVRPFARAMPGACRALWANAPPNTDGDAALHEPHALVRHFLAVHLDRLVRGTRFTQTALRSVEGSFLVQALPPPARSAAGAAVHPIDERTWMRWRRWRDRIRQTALHADERVCFRLADADGVAPDTWRLEWLLASRRDPSLLVPLADFWASGTDARPPPRSVREVLLQLGQAARIYPRLWDGMDSEAPTEVVLDRDEALDFLRRQAPILQGAGFRVMVPAWWTATGRRRLRLRLTSRGAGGSEAQGSETPAMLGFDTLLTFEPHVVLDGTPISRDEWDAVVAAKEGLVRLRGQWMELHGDEVSRLEQYWEADAGVQKMTVADLLHAEAGSDAPEVVAKTASAGCSPPCAARAPCGCSTSRPGSPASCASTRCAAFPGWRTWNASASERVWRTTWGWARPCRCWRRCWTTRPATRMPGPPCWWRPLR